MTVSQRSEIIFLSHSVLLYEVERDNKSGYRHINATCGYFLATE
jgi:hypothetical protein